MDDLGGDCVWGEEFFGEGVGLFCDFQMSRAKNGHNEKDFSCVPFSCKEDGVWF